MCAITQQNPIKIPYGTTKTYLLCYQSSGPFFPSVSDDPPKVSADKPINDNKPMFQGT